MADERGAKVPKDCDWESRKPGERAAMVLPDNCLFEGKAGEVFELLKQDCALRTVLLAPRGTFTLYARA